MQETVSAGEVVVDAGAADAASRPLSVVKNVEGFRTKLETCRFVDFEVFEQSHVKVGPARHVQNVTIIQGGHFLRGRILTQLGRTKEAKGEFALAQKTLDTQLGKERESREQNRVPNPELTREP
jgi:hypothetical protein